MAITKGETVRFRINGKTAYGIVRTAPEATATGPMVKVELLPDFQKLTPGSGWVDASADPSEMYAVKVCGCAYLGYRPQWGDHQGKLFTTGCDFGRRPSRTSTFLPGHDAKAKGFLIKASGMTSTLENGKGALETAREFGDKIALAVAKGMDAAREKSHKLSTSRMWRNVKDDVSGPAIREDELADFQKLQKELGVTEAMIRALVSGALSDHRGLEGRISAPTGTMVALQTRGLASWGYITDLGAKIIDQPTTRDNAVGFIVCEDETGGYVNHTGHPECKRCGKARDDS